MALPTDIKWAMLRVMWKVSAAVFEGNLLLFVSI